jgi:hypothetical protein
MTLVKCDIIVQEKQKIVSAMYKQPWPPGQQTKCCAKVISLHVP